MPLAPIEQYNFGTQPSGTIVSVGYAIPSSRRPTVQSLRGLSMGWRYDKSIGWQPDAYTPLFDDLWSQIVTTDEEEAQLPSEQPLDGSLWQEPQYVPPMPPPRYNPEIGQFEQPAPPEDLEAPEAFELPEGERVAESAGEQDHSNPWVYAGEDADAPEDTGKAPDGLA